DGHVITLGSEGSRRVQVDEVEATETGWRLVGWGADVTEKRTPDRFYVFAGDVLVFSGPPNVENANVVRWFDSDDLLDSGFDIEIDAADVPEGLDRLLVVAEFGSEAVADPATLTR
ncbi:MAG TPA: hypothetical protein VI141_08350, partial [Acidimicrobiia bacterium]